MPPIKVTGPFPSFYTQRTHPKRRTRSKRRRFDQAIAYVRVSSTRQVEGPEGQRRLIKEWAAREGCEVIAWHEDRLPGNLNVWERPELLKALCSFEEGEAGLLVFAQRDRLARDPFQMQLIQQMVRVQGGRLVAANGVANGEGPFEDFARLVLDGVAGLERAMIALRTRAVFQVRRNRGEVCSHLPPFGFSRHGRNLVPNPHEQWVIKECVRFREMGLSLNGIHETLKELGIKGRTGYLYPAQIGRICQSAFACGSSDYASLAYLKVAGAQTLEQLLQRAKQ